MNVHDENGKKNRIHSLTIGHFLHEMISYYWYDCWYKPYASNCICLAWQRWASSYMTWQVGRQRSHYHVERRAVSHCITHAVFWYVPQVILVLKVVYILCVIIRSKWLVSFSWMPIYILSIWFLYHLYSLGFRNCYLNVGDIVYMSACLIILLHHSICECYAWTLFLDCFYTLFILYLWVCFIAFYPHCIICECSSFVLCTSIIIDNNRQIFSCLYSVLDIWYALSKFCTWYVVCLESILYLIYGMPWVYSVRDIWYGMCYLKNNW